MGEFLERNGTETTDIKKRKTKERRWVKNRQKDKEVQTENKKIKKRADYGWKREKQAASERKAGAKTYETIQ
jgi:hypothetical protein